MSLSSRRRWSRGGGGVGQRQRCLPDRVEPPPWAPGEGCGCVLRGRRSLGDGRARGWKRVAERAGWRAAELAYAIQFAESVTDHFGCLTASERTKVLGAIVRQLMHQPLVETRNRKPLRPNPLAPWELRVGALRVFYEVVSDDPEVVRVLAVGKKQRNVLRIAGQEIKL